MEFFPSYKKSDLAVLLYEAEKEKIEEIKIRALIRTPYNTLMLLSETGEEISLNICAREDILEIHERVFSEIKNLEKNDKKVKLYALYGCDAVRAYYNHQEGSKKSVEEEIEDKSGGCYEYIEKVFNTEEEKNAYIEGANDMSGWGDSLFLTEKLML